MDMIVEIIAGVKIEMIWNWTRKASVLWQERMIRFVRGNAAVPVVATVPGGP